MTDHTLMMPLLLRTYSVISAMTPRISRIARQRVSLPIMARRISRISPSFTRFRRF